MKRLIFIIVFCLISELIFSQAIHVAIADFENLSGNAKYDGLGKALSSMLISDIELNVSGKKIQLVERGQLNKILKEQNIQTGKSFDKNSTVQIGKLLGINFILVGDLFVMNDDIIINARLTSVENGEIKFSNKQEGKLTQWLTVKTKIAKDLSNNLKVPFTDPSMPDKDVNPGIITKYASAIEEIDKGNFEKAATIAETVKEINPDFTYSDDLLKEIDKIKKEISLLRNEVEASVLDPIKTGFIFYDKKDYDQAIKYFNIGLSRTENIRYGDKYAYFNFLSNAYLKKGDFIKSVAYSDTILTINPFEQNAIKNKAASFIKSGEVEKGIALFNELFEKRKSIISSKNPDYIYNSVYKLLMNHKDFRFDGLEIITKGEFGRIGTINLKNIINYTSVDDFRKNFINNDNGKYIFAKEGTPDQPIRKIISNNYEFSQILDLEELITFYSSVLYESGFKPLTISKLIDDIHIVDTINIFDKYKESGLYVNSGEEYNIKNNYVFANSGKNYIGPALYYKAEYNEIEGVLVNPRFFLKFESRGVLYGMYAFPNLKNEIAKTGNNGTNELIILKYMYDNINNSKNNLDINNNTHAFQIYKSAWFKLRGGDYKVCTKMFISLTNFYYKLAALGEDGDNFIFHKDWEMFHIALLNLGHSYLLSGDLVNASDSYNRANMNKSFGEMWSNMSKTDMIKKDWNEFVSKNLITQKEIDDFNLKYKIIN